MRRVYYGWPMVVALALAQMVSWGVVDYAFTVFVDPMRQSLGWSNASIAGAFSLGLLVAALVALPFGRWLDAHGPRLLMSAGSALSVSLLLAWSQARDLWEFYLIWTGLGIAMGAILYEPAFFTVAIWFHRRRGQALATLTFIAGFASAIFIPLAGWLAQTQGWRGALITLALIVAAVTLPIHLFVLRRRPSDLGLAPDGDALAPAAWPDAPAAGAPGISLAEAIRDRAFWLLAGAFFCATFVTSAIFVYLVPYLITRGAAPALAASVTGAVGVVALPGRTLLVGLSRRRVVAVALFLALFAGLLALVLIPGVGGVVAFVALFGAGFGASAPLRAALLAERYGAASFGAINGAVALALNLARALAPVSIGALYGAVGGYEPVFWALATLCALAAGLMALTGLSGWR